MMTSSSSASIGAKVRAGIHRQLDTVGTKNSGALPQGVANIDALLHDLFVANEGRSYFTAKHKQAIAAIHVHLDGNGKALPEPGDKAVLETGEVYDLIASVNKPYARLDKALLRVALGKRLKGAECEAVIDESFKLGAPPVKLEVAPLT